MTRHAKSKPLHCSELEYFDEFLADLSGPIRSFEALDGLFCALICAQRLTAPVEHIDTIMGSDSGNANEETVNKIKDLMDRHCHTILGQLQRTHRTDDIYVPALIVDEHGVTTGCEWAQGFMTGVSLSAQDWTELRQDEALAPMIAPMIALAAEQDPDPTRHSPTIAPENREDLLEDMFVGLADLYAHFESRRRAKTVQKHNNAQP